MRATHYWRDWAEYLEAHDPNGLARFREIGCLVMKTGQNGYLAKHIENSRILGCPFEEWDAEQITARLPVYDLTGYFPPKRDRRARFRRAGRGCCDRCCVLAQWRLCQRPGAVGPEPRFCSQGEGGGVPAGDDGDGDPGATAAGRAA